MPQLSVIVPLFNAESFVATTLATLERNRFPGVEFVLVDDCSTDGTRAALLAGTDGWNDVSLVLLDENVGLASARNAGLEVAGGRYVCFLDADDWLAPGYLGELCAAIETLACDFVRVDHVSVTGRSRRIVRSPESRRNVVLDPRDSILPVHETTGIDYPYAWAGIFDTHRISADVLRFDDGLKTAEDRPWIWRLYLGTNDHAVVPLTGLFYRRGVSNSLTQVGDTRQLDFIRAFETVVDMVDRDRDAELFMAKAVRMYCAVMAHQVSLRSRFEPHLHSELRDRCSASLQNLPQPTLSRVLDDMSDDRAVLLHRLRRRTGGGLRW